LNASPTARTDAHYLISKSGDADRVATGVSTLEDGARKEEIARMLAGATVTDEARAAAARLLRENAAAG
jgi:DNA repair protein RecN (Recombination protein N)